MINWSHIEIFFLLFKSNMNRMCFAFTVWHNEHCKNPNSVNSHGHNLYAIFHWVVRGKRTSLPRLRTVRWQYTFYIFWNRFVHLFILFSLQFFVLLNFYTTTSIIEVFYIVLCKISSSNGCGTVVVVVVVSGMAGWLAVSLSLSVSLPLSFILNLFLCLSLFFPANTFKSRDSGR